MDGRFLSSCWTRQYKMVRIGRLYLEVWGHTMWFAARSDNFYALALGRFGLAWARF